MAASLGVQIVADGKPGFAIVDLFPETSSFYIVRVGVYLPEFMDCWMGSP